MTLANLVVARHLKANIPLGREIENGSVRIHRYRDLFMVTDLTNAGKRGKKVNQASISPSYSFKGDREAWFDRMGDAIASYTRYSQVLAFFRDILVDYPGEIDISENTERGVDVRPGGLTKIRLQTSKKPDGSHMVIESNPLDWSVKSVAVQESPKGGTFNMDTLYRPAGSKTVAEKGAAIFNKWLTENLSRVNKMTILELRKVWSDLGVQYDYH